GETGPRTQGGSADEGEDTQDDEERGNGLPEGGPVGGGFAAGDRGLQILELGFEGFVGFFAGGLLSAERQKGVSFSATGGTEEECSEEQGDGESFQTGVSIHGGSWLGFVF